MTKISQFAHNISILPRPTKRGFLFEVNKVISFQKYVSKQFYKFIAAMQSTGNLHLKSKEI